MEPARRTVQHEPDGDDSGHAECDQPECGAHQRKHGGNEHGSRAWCSWGRRRKARCWQMWPAAVRQRTWPGWHRARRWIRRTRQISQAERSIRRGCRAVSAGEHVGSTVAFSATPTVAVSCLNALVHMPLTGNITSMSFTGLQAGQRLTLIFQVSGAGGWTVSWPSQVAWRLCDEHKQRVANVCAGGQVFCSAADCGIPMARRS